MVSFVFYNETSAKPVKNTGGKLQIVVKGLPEDELKDDNISCDTIPIYVTYVNIDDDDGDGGTGGHGQNVIVSDLIDTEVVSNGVPVEQDYARLIIKKAEDDENTTGLIYGLIFSEDNINIYTNKGKTDASKVTSAPAGIADIDNTVTTFNPTEQHVLYVEGKKPNKRNVITLNMYKDTDNSCVGLLGMATIIVAETVVIVTDMEDVLNNLNTFLTSKKIDDRSYDKGYPFIIPGTDNNKNNYYAVWLGKTEKEMKNALQTKDAYVIFAGHSRYGVGMKLSPVTNSLNDFMNLSTGHWGGGGEVTADVPLYFKASYFFNDSNIENQPKNYKIENISSLPINSNQRFPNSNGIGLGKPFKLINNEYHFLSTLTNSSEVEATDFTIAGLFDKLKATTIPTLPWIKNKIIINFGEMGVGKDTHFHPEIVSTNLDNLINQANLTNEEKIETKSVWRKLDKDIRKNIIVKSSKADFPTLRYKVFFHAGCYSELYYYEGFTNHSSDAGVFFCTRDDMYAGEKMVKSFFNFLRKYGDNWNNIKTDMNTFGPVLDRGKITYHENNL